MIGVHGRFVGRQLRRERRFTTVAQHLPSVHELEHVGAQRRQLRDLDLEHLEQPADLTLQRLELGGGAR